MCFPPGISVEISRMLPPLTNPIIPTLCMGQCLALQYLTATVVRIHISMSSRYDSITRAETICNVYLMNYFFRFNHLFSG